MSPLRRLCLLGLAMLSAPADLAAATLPDLRVPDTSGVNIGGIPLEEVDFDRIRKTGFRWVRRGVLWTSLEQVRGVYDFSEADRLIAACEEHGLGLVCTLAFGTPLYEPDQHWMGVRTPEGRAGFAAYATAMAERYRARR